jgi:H(+)-translocating pyrophosphatase
MLYALWRKMGPGTRTVWLAGLLAFLFLAAGEALGSSGGGGLHGEIGDLGKLNWLWWIAPLGSLIALGFAYYFYKTMMQVPGGDKKMVEIADAVRIGAMAYLKRQYKVVTIFFIVTSIILAIMAAFGLQSWFVPFAFFTGGFFSGLAGFFGMWTATNASNRTTQGAKESLNSALQVSFRSGAVMGLTVVGLGLLDICMWFLILYWLVPKLGVDLTLTEITVTMLCFGMGASSQALFARVGGGIFTKAADVGADLVGKVEAGIPEDDPRNPATIADNVGDNVGDVAGMGADLYESYCGSILATAALGVAAAIMIQRFPSDTMAQALAGLETMNIQLRFLATPMIIAGFGVVLSIIGIYMVRTRETATQEELLKALFRGINGSSLLVAVVSLFVCWGMLGPILGFWGAMGVFGSIIAGLVAGIAIGYSTTYYTSDAHRPTRDVAYATKTGTATYVIAGIAEGLLSTGYPVLIIATGMALAYGLAGGFTEPALGLYGVGIAAVGMLSTLGITLATDAYGPIADNAGGNAVMSGQKEIVRDRTDALDSLGNTTAATGKGFAIGSAALTALALLAAYVEEVRIGVIRVAEWSYESSANLKEDAFLKTPGGLVKVKGFVDVDYDVYARKAKSGKVDGYLKVGEPQEDPETKRKIPVLVNAEAARLSDFMAFYRVNLMNPKVLIGMLLGAMLAFVFCALTMKAVGRAAGAMVEEVRRQFRTIKGIMTGKVTPDYQRCVTISTAGAQREMIFPSLMAIIVPVLVGMVLGVAGVMGLLMGGLATGFVLAIMMANAGGAWDNAKKFIERAAMIENLFAPKAQVNKALKAKGAKSEDGVLVLVDTGQDDALLKVATDTIPEGEQAKFLPVRVYRGKGSENHKAGVVGDTVGDPFKDTSGPSLNILIKLMSMVSVVFAGLTVKFGPIIGGLLGLGSR